MSLWLYRIWTGYRWLELPASTTEAEARLRLPKVGGKIQRKGMYLDRWEDLTNT